MHYRVLALLLLLLSFSAAVNAQDNPIRFDEPRFILEPQTDDRYIADLAYSPDGAILAAAGRENAFLWDAATGEPSAQFEVDEPLKRIAFLPDGDLLAIYGEDKVRIWNIDTGDVRADFSTGQPIVAVAVSPDGTTLGLAEGTGVSLLNLPAAESGDVWTHSLVANDSQRKWDAVTFDPTGQYLAAGYIVSGGPLTEFSVSMWDVNTDELVREFDLETSYAVTDLKFSADGILLAATGSYSRVWGAQTGEILYVTPAYEQNAFPETGISFSGDYLIFSDIAPPFGGLETITLRDIPTGDLLALFKQSIPLTGSGGGDGVFYHPVTFHPDGTQFATLDKGGQVVVWDIPADLAAADTAVDIFAYCDDLSGRKKQPGAADDVNIIWSWYATEIGLIFDHMGWSSYSITLDGQALPVDTALRSAIRRDPANDNHWTLYYSLNVGALTPGTHTITYDLTWDKAISDGLEQFGPGTPNLDDSGACTFEVDG
jgi:WD40 repeat protein